MPIAAGLRAGLLRNPALSYPSPNSFFPCPKPIITLPLQFFGVVVSCGGSSSHSLTNKSYTSACGLRTPATCRRLCDSNELPVAAKPSPSLSPNFPHENLFFFLLLLFLPYTTNSCCFNLIPPFVTFCFRGGRTDVITLQR